MRRRYPYAVAFKIVLMLAAVGGIALQCMGGAEGFSLQPFKMFPTLSNLFVVFYQAVQISALVQTRGEEDFSHPIQFMSLVTVVLSGLITLVMGKYQFAGNRAMLLAAMILMNIIVPLMSIIDWMFFTRKGTYEPYYPLLSLIPLAVYVAAVYIGKAAGFPLGPSRENPYPYDFLNLEVMGVVKILIVCIIIGGAAVMLGWFLYKADYVLSWQQAEEKENKKKKSRRKRSRTKKNQTEKS